MKRVLTITIVIIILFIAISCKAESVPEKSPSLFIKLEENNTPVQRIRTIQGVTNWVWDGGAILSDSPHPLQLHPDNFSEATLFISSNEAIIEMEFTGNFQPDSISAVRWNAEHLTGRQPSEEAFDSWITVEVVDSKIIVSEDGENYVYQVTANWQNNSFVLYSFRIVFDIGN